MKGFVIDPTYRIVNDKAYVFLFGKLENGESFVTINEQKPYFYIKKNEQKKALNYGEFEIQKCNFKNFDNEEVVKVLVNLPSEVPPLREKLIKGKIDCYEADIKFAYRFLIDNKLQGCIEINGEYESNDYVDRVYKNPIIDSCEYIPNLKVLSFDIELDLEGTKILCVSIYSEEFKKVFIVSEKKLKNAVSCKNESEMLEKFKEKVLEIDPDVLTGWNFIDLDMAFLKERFKENKIPFLLGRDNSQVKLRLESSFIKSSTAYVTGRACLDGMHLLRNSFIDLQDYKLETASQKVLGYGKLLTGSGRGYKIQEYYEKDQQKLVNYNLRDAELVYELLYKSKVLELNIKKSIITGLPLERVNGSIAALDFLYIKEAMSRRVVCPTLSYKGMEIRTTGGYVKDPIPGIYDNIIVLDFKSLYPSIMRTFNIDPYSYVENCKLDMIKAPNGACFRNEDGIMPILLEKIWKERDEAKKKKDELTRYALKIQLNSMYGVLASPNCRFYNPSIANAITHFGHYIIKLTDKVIENLGYKIIYNDTDSFFVVSNAKNLKDAEKIGTRLREEINKYYKKYVKEKYKRNSILEMEFEKVYSRFLMPKLRGREKGAKKRYAGLVNGKLETVGLESVRGDWTEAAKEFQQELLKKVFEKEEVDVFVKKFVDKIIKGKLDEKLIYKKQIRKDLSDYTKTSPPHVKAARKLKVLESNLIEYVITTDGPEPIQDIRHDLDYKHYIEKQIKPIADSVLCFFDTNFESLIEGKQKSLFDY